MPGKESHLFNANSIRAQLSFLRCSHIMQAEDWTRAIFVRDPKERFLSAYLDKAVEEMLFVDSK